MKITVSKKFMKIYEEKLMKRSKLLLRFTGLSFIILPCALHIKQNCRSIIFFSDVIQCKHFLFLCLSKTCLFLSERLFFFFSLQQEMCILAEASLCSIFWKSNLFEPVTLSLDQIQKEKKKRLDLTLVKAF